MTQKFSLPSFGYEVALGKFAQQADGSVWLRQGGTVVLATVVTSPSKEFPGFLPLSVDYREQFSAAGKIPGGYFKREGRYSDKEVLTARLIDRSLRPLFPERFFDQVQILITVYSVDKEHMPEPLALVASSLALSLSKIPFLEPVGVVEAAKDGDTWIYNPTYQQAQASPVRLIVAGTKDGICMVEGSADSLSEKEFVDVLFTAHEKIKEQVAWQKEIQDTAGVAKEPISEGIDWATWYGNAEKFLTPERLATCFVLDKVERSAAISALQEEYMAAYEAQAEEQGVPLKIVNYAYDAVLKAKLTEQTFAQNKRVDTRNFDEVRKLSIEVGLLPFVHGSALFKRGRTQALVSTTLGGGQDEQKVEDLMGDTIDSKFMLHYNFPPFSVGEVRPMRGPGRREVGHGYLAKSAIKAVLPNEKEFPYTIRLVADILESDGSSSMATVCGSTMALMDAGVPIQHMVSGVAMGLIKSDDGQIKVLTDISGLEDAFGLMDFKVAGTENGITAIQMDIKHKGGLERAVFEQALEQARKGRLHILDKMRAVMSQPRAQLSELVPQVVSFKVPTDKIGAIIGPGGKVIRDIIDKTGTTIDIEDDGTVKIFGHRGEKMDQAITWVKTIGGNIERGMRYQGIIKRLAEFGIFVEVAPGTDGLIHVSAIPRDKQRTFNKDYTVGDVVDVEVTDYDPSNGRIRLRFINEKK